MRMMEVKGVLEMKHVIVQHSVRRSLWLSEMQSEANQWAYRNGALSDNYNIRHNKRKNIALHRRYRL